MRGWAVATLVLGSSLVCCQLVAPLDGLTNGAHPSGWPGDGASPGGDDAADGSVGAPDAVSRPDAPSDALSTDAADAADAGGPVTLVSVGAGVTAPSGHAQQGHLVWAAGASRWWLFYADASQPAVLQATSSSDFQAWSPAATLALPGPLADGRDLAAWAGTAGGQDVIHLAASVVVSSTDRRHLHARARPAEAALQFDAVVPLGSAYTNLPLLDPDGPATALAGDGTLFDTSGWSEGPDAGPVGNEYAWASAGPDPGGPWTPSFGAVQTLQVVPQYVNARALVALPGGPVMALWEGGDAEPDPSNVHFSVSSSGAWSAAAAVFQASTQDANDWGACPLGSAVHAVRHTTAGHWEHRVWSGTPAADASVDGGGGSFADGGAIPPLDAPAGTGAVVLCDATSVRVFAIAPDAGNPVRTTRWDGSSWSAWTDAVVAGGQRTFLTGTMNPAGGIALAWTETASGSSVIAGALVAP